MPRRPVAKSEVRRGSIFHERSYSVTRGLHVTRNKHRIIDVNDPRLTAIFRH